MKLIWREKVHVASAKKILHHFSLRNLSQIKTLTELNRFVDCFNFSGGSLLTSTGKRNGSIVSSHFWRCLFQLTDYTNGQQEVRLYVMVA